MMVKWQAEMGGSGGNDRWGGGGRRGGGRTMKWRATCLKEVWKWEMSI